MARKTKDEALATRSAILDAAEQVFQRQGVSHTTLQDIAQAAGVTRGAVYWHFEDKADLFSSMLDRACMPIEEAAVDAFSVPADRALASLRAHVLEIFRLVARDERARRVFEIATQKVEYVDAMCAVRTRHLECRAEHVAQIEGMVRRAQKAGHVAVGLAARQVALGLHAIVDGLLQNWLLDPAAFDLLRTGSQAVDIYLAGLRPAAPVASSGKAAPRRAAIA